MRRCVPKNSSFPFAASDLNFARLLSSLFSRERPRGRDGALRGPQFGRAGRKTRLISLNERPRGEDGALAGW